MMDFVKNWVHFVRKARLEPFLVGAADPPKACGIRHGAAGGGDRPRLDVWTYRRKAARPAGEVCEMKTVSASATTTPTSSRWASSRSPSCGSCSRRSSTCSSDLDVVWLNDHWQRWMTWAEAQSPPVHEAALIAMADVLVATDELSAIRDAKGGRLHAGGHTGSARGLLPSQQGSSRWCRSGAAMLRQKGRKDLNENVNDQSLFNQVVGGSLSGGASRRYGELLAGGLRLGEGSRRAPRSTR